MKFQPGRETKVYIQNDSVYRQPETTARMHLYDNLEIKYFDKTIDILLTKVAESLNQEIKESPESVKLFPEKFVDIYGVDSPGFINFTEFKEIYRNHVHYADEGNYNKEMLSDDKLLALFNVLSPD
jgi:hypothetical protein